MHSKSTTSDEHLVLLIREGNREAYASLFHRYFPAVAAFCNGILKNPALSEDIAQEVMLTVWVKRQELFCIEGTLRHFIFTVCRNRVMSFLRSRYATSCVPLEPVHGQVAGESAADDKLHYDYLLRSVSESLDSMPPRRREVLSLSRQDGLSRKEIAKELGVSEATVKKHMELALRQLRSSVDVKS